MKVNYRLVLTMLSGVALGATVITGLKAQAKPPVYVIIDISEMLDVDAYVKAVSAAEPKATTSAGGRFIIRTAKAIALDGPAPNRFVAIAFDSEEKAKAWYDSPAIKDVNAVRLKAAKSRAFIVEGLAN
jgi:uncharacterized protein (DUF1330 family)